MSRPFILLTNDDGYQAQGLLTLYRQLLRVADCFVVAPAEESSASSHAVTLREPLKVEEIFDGSRSMGYKVWGKPSDCVKLALCELCPRKPDFIVSGVNNGPNVGISTIYSGTVAGAREGAIAGIRSFAFSVNGHDFVDCDGACELALEVLAAFRQEHVPPSCYLNINIPNLPKKDILGIRITRQADSYFKEAFERLPETKQGQRCYALTGEMIVVTRHDENDVEVLENGYVSVTPLHLNLTEEAYRMNLKTKENAFFGRTFAWFLPALVAAALFFASPVFADKIILHNGQSYEGIILSDEADEIALQVEDAWKVFPKVEVLTVEVWDTTRNTQLRSKWQVKGAWESMRGAWKEGPSGWMKLVRPYHSRIMRWCMNTPVYQFVMKWSYLQQYRKNNPIGFQLSIYCILMMLAALVLRLVKEAFFLALSFFGFNSDK